MEIILACQTRRVFSSGLYVCDVNKDKRRADMICAVIITMLSLPILCRFRGMKFRILISLVLKSIKKCLKRARVNTVRHPTSKYWERELLLRRATSRVSLEFLIYVTGSWRRKSMQHDVIQLQWESIVFFDLEDNDQIEISDFAGHFDKCVNATMSVV